MNRIVRLYANSRLLSCVFVLALGAAACSAAQPSPLVEVEAELSPILAYRDSAAPVLQVLQPVDDEQVTSPFTLIASLDNSVLAPKGRVRDGEGHLHVLIDKPCVTPGKVIPDSEFDIHVGSGIESVELDLEPGKHRLCVQIGDGFHSATSIQAELTVIVVEP